MNEPRRRYTLPLIALVTALALILIGFPALVLTSPAVAVGLGPDWLVGDLTRTLRIVFGVALAGLVAAAVLAGRRGRGGLATLAVVAALGCLLVIAGSGRLAQAPPGPVGCAAYSGGSHTCPGG